MLKIKNQTDNSADLYISGTITDDEDGNWIKEWTGSADGYPFPAELRRQLDELKGKDLTIYINSYGGSIPAGMAMAHMISRHKGATKAIVDGYCCSIATQIFFSAEKCLMYPNSWLMIHKPWTSLAGDSNELRKAAEVLDTLQKGLEDTYLKRVQENVSSDDVHKMVEDETWLTGTEAAEKFKIELLESKPMMNCAGSREKLKAMGAKKIPQSLKFLSTEKENATQEDWSAIEIALAISKGAIL